MENKNLEQLLNLMYEDIHAIKAAMGIQTECNVHLESTTPSDLETVVTHIMADIGIPAHLKGYKYVRKAIMMAVEDAEVLESMTKVLYPEVAKAFNTTPSRVERAIRHAVEVAWDRGQLDVLARYFGNSVDPMRGKPVNSEFIAKIVDIIHRKGVENAMG